MNIVAGVYGERLEAASLETELSALSGCVLAITRSTGGGPLLIRRLNHLRAWLSLRLDAQTESTD